MITEQKFAFSKEKQLAEGAAASNAEAPLSMPSLAQGTLLARSTALSQPEEKVSVTVILLH